MVQNGASSLARTDGYDSGAASRAELAVWGAFVVLLLGTFGVASFLLWVAEPVALLALPIPFAATLILLVVVHDRHVVRVG